MLKTYRYKVDFSDVKHFIEIHEVLKRDLEFPDYYGGHLDALWDCLTDMYGDPIHIEIIGLDVIEKKFDNMASKMIEILTRFKHVNNDLFCNNIKIEIVSDGKRIEIE